MIVVGEDLIWIVVVAFIVAFVLAFGIGANDVANSFGTSVGSKVLTLKQACILATVCETAGSVLLGAKVSETIRKGIIDVEMYEMDNVNRTHNGTGDGSKLMMLGQLSSLTGACVWLLVATFFRVPVSGTHSIVGATVGFSLVAKGTAGVDWKKLGLIVASWFVSPLLSGAISVGFFYLVRRLVLLKEDALEPGLRFLPVIYGFTVVINVFSIVYEGPDLLKFNLIPLWGAILIAYAVGIVCSALVKVFIIPWQRRRIIREVSKQDELDRLELAEAEAEAKLKRLEEAEGERSLSESEGARLMEDSAAADRRLEDRIPEKIAEEDEGVTDSTMALDKMKIAPDGSETKTAGNSKRKLQIQLPFGFKKDKDGKDDKSGYKEVPPSDNNGDTIDNLKSDGPQEEVGVAVPNPDTLKDRPEQSRIFAWLQILTAIFGSFAHGGNDVSNAIGPLIGLWIIATTGNITGQTMTPIYILLFGGAGISIGLWIWGRRVIRTLGEDLTTITPSSGFCIELGAALAVLIASNIGIPISTTHCKVGSVVLVGFFRSRDNVQWAIFRNILIAWLVTLPISGAISGAIMAALRAIVFRSQ